MNKLQIEEIPSNYFYQMFQKEVHKGILNLQQNRIQQEEDEISYFDVFPLNKEEQDTIYDKALMEVCTNFITLENLPIDILPNNPLELVDLILATIPQCTYQESFLESLPFIYQIYFENMNLGFPTLMSTDDPKSCPVFKVTWGHRNQMMSFDAVNMSLLEQNKIMTRFLIMETKNQIGPIPKLLHYIRRDI